MKRITETPTDPSTLAEMLADLPVLELDDEQPLELAPLTAGWAVRVTPTGAVRVMSSNPTRTGATAMAKHKTQPTEVAATDIEVADALAAISDTGAPRWLTSFEQEEWHTATAILDQWTTNGLPNVEVTFDALVADLLKVSPETGRTKAKLRVSKTIGDLIARSIDNGGERIAQVQLGDNIDTDPVMVLVALPDHLRMARTYEAAVVVWWPDGVYTFTDPDTDEAVSIPSLFRGKAGGFARRFVDIDDATAEFDLLKQAVRTMARLSNIDPDDGGEGFEGSGRPPKPAAF